MVDDSSDGEKEYLWGGIEHDDNWTPPEAKDIGSVGTGGEGIDGSGVPKGSHSLLQI